MGARAPVVPLLGWDRSRAILLPVLLTGASFGCDMTLALVNRLPGAADGASAVGDTDGGALPSGDDSGADAAAAVDAAAGDEAATIGGDGATTDSPGSGPFGTATLVPVISTGSTWDEDPTLTADQLEMYFESSRSAGNQDIWVSRRASVTAPWDAPQRVAELSTAAAEQGPAVSLDGLTIWFGTNRGSTTGVDYDIWTASRLRRTEPSGALTPWGAPTRVAELATTSVETAPSVDESGLVMVFMSNRPGGAGGYDIYMTTRPTTAAAWKAPVNLANVNTTNDELDPFLGGQTRQLFWQGFGAQIWWATRPSSTQPFVSPKPLPELGSPDYCPTLSVDLHHIWFGTSRAGGRKIYEALR